MRETSARLLRLLALLQSRPHWPGPELAGRLQVTARTLRRDVQRLRDLDYPVHSVSGAAGGYRLGSGAKLPPLLLDDDEAIAVVIGLRGTASHTVAGLSDASVRALAKLEQVLPARLRERTAALGQVTVPLIPAAAVVDPQVLTALASACRSRRRLRLAYRDHSGAVTRRTVEPHRLVSTGYRWYLMAFDAERADWRTFRVDRISSPEDAGRFAPRQAPDAAAFVASAVTTAPYRFQATVLVRAPLREVSERVSPATGILEDIGDGQCRLTTGADSLEALVFHLAGLDTEFTVIEPPELANRLREIAARLLRGAGEVPGAGCQGGGAPRLSPGRQAEGRRSAGRPPR